MQFLSLPFVLIFFAGTLLILLSAVAFLKLNNDKWGVAFLFLGSLGVRLFMAWQDRFLHLWDERFHALVATSLLKNPLKPVLRAHPIEQYHPHNWVNNHIWLHKQPLFLWQIAASLKIFGVSEFAVRYPSVLLGALSVVLLYSISKSITNNKVVAFIAALLLCFNNYQLELISGAQGMDHNDIAFCFYVLASFWAYVQYSQGRSYKYAILIGFFAGCAILNKWLTGLVVFAAWGSYLLFAIDKKEKPAEVFRLATALIVCIVIVLPWQLYILYTYHFEASYEYAFNTRHITEVIEGHSGTNLFYVDNFEWYFGEVGWLLVPAGLMLTLIKAKQKQLASVPGAIGAVIVFLTLFVFFSHIVRTKMPGYFFVGAPFGLLFIALALVEIYKQIVSVGKPRLGLTTLICLVIVIAVSVLNPERVVKWHNPGDSERLQLSHNTKVYKRLKERIPPNAKVIVTGVGGFEDILALFYNNDLAIYGALSKQELDTLAREKAVIAAFNDRVSGKLPEDMQAYPYVYTIADTLR